MVVFNPPPSLEIVCGGPNSKAALAMQLNARISDAVSEILRKFFVGQSSFSLFIVRLLRFNCLCLSTFFFNFFQPVLNVTITHRHIVINGRLFNSFIITNPQRSSIDYIHPPGTRSVIPGCYVGRRIQKIFSGDIN